MMEPNYYAIIPASVRYDKTIPPNAKLLYGEITALSNKEGHCYAGNAYFAELYGVDKDTVSGWVSKLRKAGHIDPQVNPKTGERKIFITEPLRQKTDTPPINIVDPPDINRNPLREKSDTPTTKGRHNTTVNTTTNKGNAGSDEPPVPTLETEPQKTKPVKLNYPPDFEVFWKDSDKPSASKKKAFDEWKKLPESARIEAVQKLPDYKLLQPDATYRRDPERFLRDRLYSSDFQAALRQKKASPVAGTVQAVVTTNFKNGSPD